MKKKIFFLVLVLIIPTLLAASCYSTWNEAFTEAEKEYRDDLKRCERAWINDFMCFNEAEAEFTNATTEAGNEYYHCVL